MSDTIAVANVATRFVVDPSVSGLSSISRQITNISGQITGMGRLFATVAGGYGLEKLVGSVVKLNEELQDASYGMATLFSAIDHRKFTDGLQLARGVIKDLRADAAAGVGGFQDYLQSYNKIYAPLRQSGASGDQIRELNRLVIAAGFAQGKGPRGAQQAALDVVQALQGHASTAVTPVVAEALASVGINIKTFKREDSAKQLQDLIKGFGSFKEAADEMGKTWSSRVETFKNSVQNFALTVSGGLFDRWNEDLGSINDWLEKNRATLDDIANRIGARLLYVFDRLSKNPAGSFAALAAAGAGASAAGGLARSGFALSAPMMAPVGAAWNASAGRYQMPSGKFAAPTPLGSSLGLSGAVGGVATLGWVGAIAAAVGLLTGSVAAAAGKFPNLVANISESIGQFVLEGENFFESVARFFTNPISLGIGKFVLNMADVLIQAAGKTIRFFSILIDFFTAVAGTAVPLSRAIGAAASGRFDDAKGFYAIAQSQLTNANWQASVGFAQLLKDLPGPPKIAPGTDGDPKGRDKPSNVTNFNGPVNVRIVAEKLDDPNAVASTFEALIERIRQRPLSSGAARLAPKPG